MLIDFNNIKEITVPGMNNGTGTMTAKMYMDGQGKVIPCSIHPGGSIGMHKHETSDDINYVISVDPPRKGMSEEVIGHIVSMQPRRIVYVSCDPATLARDLKRFAELGYKTERAEAVDMFPRTKHVETVVLMSRVQK